MITIRKHAFFIPTTRQCSAPVESALEEISQYQLEEDETVDFVLLEQNRDKISAAYGRALKEYQKQYPQYKDSFELFFCDPANGVDFL